MNLSNTGGVLIGLAFLVLALGFAADNPAAFINLPGLLIVLGGTFTAIAISYPLKEAWAAMKQARVLTEPMHLDLHQDIKRLLGFSKLWFRKQYRQLDAELEALDDPFLQRSLQMVRDRQPAEDLMATMNWHIAQYRARETAVINIFRAMATFAPAFGMVGSLVGLVNMLQGVSGADLSSMTADMAIALITTFYGLLLANLVFKPIATKLEQRRNLTTIQLSLVAEGVSLIQQQRTPAALQDTLQSFVQGHLAQDEVELKAQTPQAASQPTRGTKAKYQNAKASKARKPLLSKLGLKPV